LEDADEPVEKNNGRPETSQPVQLPGRTGQVNAEVYGIVQRRQPGLRPESNREPLGQIEDYRRSEEPAAGPIVEL